jgi:hypothetical protein
MDKICDKEGCENIIPRKFDGKFVNIQRRRFCFVCSPFGCKNTKDLNKPPTENPPTSYESVKKYRKSKKRKCIEYKGGSCIVCGYNKCERAMDFHHLDPSQKDFSISHKNHISMEKTKIELDKCVLLCCRCHMEVHDGIIDLNKGD